MKRIRATSTYVVVSAVACVIVLLPATWLTPEKFGAWATGLQTCGVLVALAIGATTVAADRHERRVERLVGFHAEYETGSISEPRQRLSRLIRQTEERGLGILSGRDLRDGSLSYEADTVGGETSTPGRDLALVLNYFDRLLKAQMRGAIDQHSLAESMGFHIRWWHKHVTDIEQFAAHRSLAAIHKLVEPHLAVNSATKSETPNQNIPKGGATTDKH
jgi:hypothetical protein